MSNILKAIVAVRRECGAITKDATNPHFKSKYATLNAILEAVEPVLEKHGVMIMQAVKGKELHTSICNVDGSDSIEQSIYPLVDSPDPQKFASSLSYARRYSIVTMLGLMTEDDDGNKAASLPVKPAQTVQTAPYKPLIGTNNKTPAPKSEPLKIEPRKPASVVNKERAESALSYDAKPFQVTVPNYEENFNHQSEAFKAGRLPAFQAGGVDVASSESYVCQFGKWKGSTIAAIIEEHGIESLDNYVSYLKKKETKGVVSEFVYHADIVMQDRASFDPSTFGKFEEQGNSDGAL